MQKYVTFAESGSLKNTLEIQIIKIIVIIEVQRIVFVISNLTCPVSKIPVVFHSSSNYDYNFIIKELEMSLRDNLNVLEKTKKNTKLFPFQ